MSGREITITKMNYEGRPGFSYAGQIVYQDEQVVVARCPWPSSRSVPIGPSMVGPGDIFMEHYYRAHWFNIFAIYDSLGVLKSWYCNITRLAEILADEIHWQDLALDLLVLPDGTEVELDRHEFEAIHPSPEVREQAEQALATLHRWVRERHPPFTAICHPAGHAAQG